MAFGYFLFALQALLLPADSLEYIVQEPQAASLTLPVTGPV
ncbi:hypothetical protein ACFQ0Q_32495 [Streptomyces aureus]